MVSSFFPSQRFNFLFSSPRRQDAKNAKLLFENLVCFPKFNLNLLIKIIILFEFSRNISNKNLAILAPLRENKGENL
jgi:hypothetical protein